MLPTIHIDSCVLFQLGINHWKQVFFFLFVYLFFFIVLTPLSCLYCVWYLSQVARESWGCRFLPGIQGRGTLRVSSAHVRLTRADAQGGAEGGPGWNAPLSLPSTSAGWFSIWRQMLSDAGLLHRAASKHATSSFTHRWFSSLWKVCWFLFFFCIFFSPSARRAATAV